MRGPYMRGPYKGLRREPSSVGSSPLVERNGVTASRAQLSAWQLRDDKTAAACAQMLSAPAASPDGIWLPNRCHPSSCLQPCHATPVAPQRTRSARQMAPKSQVTAARAGQLQRAKRTDRLMLQWGEGGGQNRVRRRVARGCRGSVQSSPIGSALG